MDSGLTRFVNRGIRFATVKGASSFVGIKTAADPASSFYLNLPTALPVATQVLAVDPSGNMSYITIGGGGSVSSVGLSAPSDLTVTGSPVTTAGTISLLRASQSANLFLASPNDSAGVPVYRGMTVTDVPSLTAAKISDFDTQVRLSRPDQLATMGANFSLGGFKATGLAEPTNAQDAVTKSYADALVTVGNNQASARAATTGDINLAAPGAAIDAVTLSNGDQVLVLAQTTGSQNGLYVWNGAAVPMTRAASADTSAEVKTGMFVFVSDGAVNANNGYTLVTQAPITLETTSLLFIQTSGAGQIGAGSGLTKTGNTIDAVGTANRISVAADNIDISASYVGQTSITTLGTVATGVWNGTTIALAYGGTGATTAAGARTALGTVGVWRQSFTNTSLTSSLLTVTHTLGQQFVSVTVYDENNKLIVTVDDVTCSSSSVFTVDLTSFGPITGTWNLIAMG